MIIINLHQYTILQHEKNAQQSEEFPNEKLLIYHKKNNFATKQQSFTLNKLISYEEMFIFSYEEKMTTPYV